MYHYGPVMVDLEGHVLTPAEHALIQHPAVGGVLLFTRNYINRQQLQDLIGQIRSAASPKPVLIAVDHEGGRIWRFKADFTPIPAAKLYGHLYRHDPIEAQRLIFDAGWVMAAELLECGLDISFTPVLDLDYGLSAVIGDRSFNSDPAVVIALARELIRGMQHVGMAATGKHFPGHGGCVPDSHITEAIDTRSLEILMQADILPFKHLASELGAIMPAHVIYPAVDPHFPCGFSKTWLQTLLRESLHFEGAIISDCLSMKATERFGDMSLRAKLALEAGCDMVIICQQDRETLWTLLEQLKTHQMTVVSEQRLAKLAGHFDNRLRLGQKPLIADLWEVS